MSAHSTTAYADAPQEGTGPGVLVLHSWWGLTEGIKDRVNELADAGFCAVAPDLFDGEVAESFEHGQAMLLEADPNELAIGVQSCADALRRMPGSTDEPIMIIGYSMGASLGLWLSEREAESVRGVVGYYGTQGIDFVETRSRYQFHMVVDDDMLDPDELALMEASLGLAGRDVDVHTYEATAHFFAEPGSPVFDPDAAGVAWNRTIEFLRATAGT